MFKVLKTTFNYVIFGVINLRNFQRQWRHKKIRCPCFLPSSSKMGLVVKHFRTLLCLGTVESVYTENSSLKATLDLCDELSREMSLLTYRPLSIVSQVPWLH